MAYDIGPKIGMDGEAEFRKQLRNINTALKTLDTEMKKVTSEFRDNAQGQDALIAKNRVLTKSVQQQEQKIKEVKDALAFATTEYGEASNEAMRWQQVLNRSEAALNDLKAEIRENDQALEEMAMGFRDAETGARKMDAALDGIDGDASKLKRLGNAADDLADRLAGVSKGAAALGGAIVGAVPATQEFRRDLSFLEQNAKQVGVGMGVAEKAFKTFNEVSGETDSAIEGVSNLLQAGFTESNLQIAVEGLAGAATRFPDTLKIEGLADGLQETLATGKAIGPFAELLDRVGIGADNFSKDLEKCTTQAQKQNLVLETLAKAGLTDSYKGWKKSNKELTDYENTMLDAQMALSDLATTVAPLVTSVAKNLTTLVKEFNKLPKPAQAAAGGLVGLTAVASPTISAVGKLSAGINTLKGNTETLTGAKATLTKGVGSLFNLLKAHPYAAAATGAVALGVAVKKVAENLNAETTAAKEAAKARQDMISSVQKESEEAQFYAQKLQELSEVENKSAGQKQLMQAYVDRLNGSVEGLNLTYDEEKDKLNQTTEAIYKKISAQKEEALQAAYVQAAKKAYEDYADAQLKADEIGSQLNEKKKQWNKLSDAEKQTNGQLAKEIGKLSRQYKDAKSATAQYAKEAQKLNNQAAIQSGQWARLKKEAKNAGIEIPKNLVQGIKNGTYAIPTTIDELNALINFQKAADNAGVQGQELVNKLQNRIANGKISVEEATKQLTNATTNQLSKGVNAAGTEGAKTGGAYASGVQSKTGASKTGGTALANSAKSGAASVSLESTGKNAGAGYAAGIRSAISDAANAAREIARAALNAAKKESKTNSPSRKWRDELGLMAGAGYTEGLKAEIPQVKKAGEELAAAALPSRLGSTIMATLGNTEEITAVARASFNVGIDYELLASMLSQGIYIEGRQIGRALREAGVVVG